MTDNIANVGTDTYVLKVASWTVSQGIDDAFATATIVLDGAIASTTCANYTDCVLTYKDHEDTERTLFSGFVPDSGVEYNPDLNTTTVTAYDYGWYLQNQRLPDGYLTTATWDDENEKVTYYEPSAFITLLLGGSLWNTTTGVYPMHVNTVTAWGGSDLPVKGWAWDRNTTKYQAICDMAEYCDFVWTARYDSTYDKFGGRFCAIGDIDTYSGAGSAETIDGTTGNDYVMSLYLDRPGSAKYNRVRVEGNRNYRILYVDDASGFSESQTITDGGTGASATIYSVDTDNDYIVISYDRTGSFNDGNTVTNGVGGTATMVGNDEFYQNYDVYEPGAAEAAAVTAMTERPREYFERLTEEYDSTALIENRRDDLYTYYCNSDSYVYKAVLCDRCDLSLWQKTKFTGYTLIPEEWMRITHIQYAATPDKGMIVTITMQNAAYIEAARRIRKSGVASDAQDLKKIVEALMEKYFKVEVGTALKVTGDGITVELREDGQVVIGEGVTN